LLSAHRLKQSLGRNAAIAASLQLSLCTLYCETAQQRRVRLAGAGCGTNPRKGLPQYGICGYGDPWVLGRHLPRSVTQRSYT